MPAGLERLLLGHIFSHCSGETHISDLLFVCLFFQEGRDHVLLFCVKIKWGNGSANPFNVLRQPELAFSPLPVLALCFLLNCSSPSLPPTPSALRPQWHPYHSLLRACLITLCLTSEHTGHTVLSFLGLCLWPAEHLCSWLGSKLMVFLGGTSAPTQMLVSSGPIPRPFFLLLSPPAFQCQSHLSSSSPYHLSPQ